MKYSTVYDCTYTNQILLLVLYLQVFNFEARIVADCGILGRVKGCLSCKLFSLDDLKVIANSKNMPELYKPTQKAIFAIATTEQKLEIINKVDQKPEGFVTIHSMRKLVLSKRRGNIIWGTSFLICMTVVGRCHLPTVANSFWWQKQGFELWSIRPTLWFL